jgi:Sulfatase
MVMLRLKKLCQCIGVASLVLVINYGEMLGGGIDLRMHTPVRLTAVCVAQITDILLLGLLMFAVLAPLQRTRAYPWLKLLLAIILPPYLLEREQAMFPFDLMDGLVPILTAVWGGLLLLLLLRFKVWYRRTMRVVSIVCASLFLFAFVSIGQLIWVATWRPPPQQISAIWETTPQPPREHPLLVWVIFDELSYDQTFEHRAKDLQLNNFDAMRSLSTLYTNVQPEGYFTAKIVPSLLTGRPIDGFHFSFKRRFSVHYEGTHGYVPLHGSDTVFADAEKDGWRTAVVGWYNPYCGIYGDAIQNCYWTNWDKIEGPMAVRNPFLTNISLPLMQVARELRSPSKADRDLCTYDVLQRQHTQLDLQDHAMQLLRTDQADFVFLHFAIPHSPNIWSRIQNDYAQHCDSSYLDNLALVDRVLGGVLTTLQASPRWKDTTLIVEGDHSWRVNSWNWLPAWTAEDDAAARNFFDTRPALLVHHAGQTQPQTEASAWPLIQVHQVVENVLQGQGPPPK